MKKCIKCQELKNEVEFNKDKNAKDKLQHYCKKCCKEYKKENREKLLVQRKKYYIKNEKEIELQQKKFYKDNKEEILIQHKKYYKDNKEERKAKQREYIKNNREAKRIYQKKYNKNNREMLNEKWKKLYHSKLKFNEKFIISRKISSAIHHSLKGNKNGQHYEDLLKFTFDELKAYLIKDLSKNYPDYTWQDYIDGLLHLDHIIPIDVFNFSKPIDIDFQKCWALSNLRLIPAHENLSKSNKLKEPFQPSFAF